MQKYKVEKVAFSLSDLDEWVEATQHVEDKKRTFYIFPKEDDAGVIWYAIEDSYFRTKDGRIHIPEHFEIPRWRLLSGSSLAHAARLCKAQVEVDYLISTGMDAMDAARLALQRCGRKNTMTINTLPEQIHPCKCGSASMMIEASFNCIYGEYMYAIIRCHQCNRAVSSTSLLGACVRWNDTMMTEKKEDK